MDDLKNYKFGLFYFNPNDSRLFVPRKLSRMPGYTINFAKPASLFIFGLLGITLMAGIYALLINLF